MYNYFDSFHAYDAETIKEASLVALMNFREEFPDAGHYVVNAFPDKGRIEVSDGSEVRTYTFEELGFTA
jgi:hypothetical protein